MLKRILSSVVGILILIPVLWFSDTFILPCAVSLISLIAMIEMLRCIGVLKKYALTIPICAVAVALPVTARLADIYVRVDISFIILAVAVCMMMYMLALSLFSHGEFTIETVSLVFVTAFYIIGGFTGIVLLRDFGGLAEGNGKYLYLLVFIGAWVTDTFAYIVGRFFGKHKLIPDVSPKKTVEGAIGGIGFCAVAYLLYGLILSEFFAPEANYIALGLIGIVISVVAQIGDLTMSHIKRRFGIKDYGRIMPGHGGVLDRFDSVLAVSITLIIALGLAATFGIEVVI